MNGEGLFRWIGSTVVGALALLASTSALAATYQVITVSEDECPTADSVWAYQSKIQQIGFGESTPDGDTCNDGSTGHTGEDSGESEIEPYPAIVWTVEDTGEMSLYARADYSGWTGYERYDRVLTDVEAIGGGVAYGEHAIVDIDFDGVDDLIVGAPLASPNGYLSGALYVYLDVGYDSPGSRSALDYDMMIPGAGYYARSGLRGATYRDIGGSGLDFYYANKYGSNYGSYAFYYWNIDAADDVGDGIYVGLSWSSGVTYWTDVLEVSEYPSGGCTIGPC